MKRTFKSIIPFAIVADVATDNVFAAGVGEAAQQETQAEMEQPISTAGTFEATLDNEYFAAKGAEVNALREAGDEAAALAAAKEMYETIGLESDSDFYQVCELIIEIKQAQPMAAEPDPAQIVQAVEQRLALDRVSYDDWDRLTDAETLLAGTHPVEAYEVNICRNWAASTTASYYGYSNGSGENADAFRHAYWNALMKLRIGDAYARLFGFAHEKMSDYYMSYIMKCGYTGQRHTDMDLFNNQLGRDCVSPISTAESAMSNILQAIKDHKHYYLHAQEECIPDSIA